MLFSPQVPFGCDLPPLFQPQPSPNWLPACFETQIGSLTVRLSVDRVVPERLSLRSFGPAMSTIGLLVWLFPGQTFTYRGTSNFASHVICKHRINLQEHYALLLSHRRDRVRGCGWHMFASLSLHQERVALGCTISSQSLLVAPSLNAGPSRCLSQLLFTSDSRRYHDVDRCLHYGTVCPHEASTCMTRDDAYGITD